MTVLSRHIGAGQPLAPTRPTSLKDCRRMNLADADADNREAGGQPPSGPAVMESDKASKRRCAIYTRKSSEEGLEQDFNSVVVYKVDRLTRSLADFAKMVETFDAHKVSFVAVTQQFNTTTSMGRLTLNVLLSFAQF